MSPRSRLACAATVLAVSLAGVAAGCGSDDGADVRKLGETTAGPAPASGSAVAGTTTVASAPFGGYEPGSDVSGHAKISLDVAEIAELLTSEPADFAAARALYAAGDHSLASDGTTRSLRAFATERRTEPVWSRYVAFYRDPAWLDTFVASALSGAGSFATAGEPARVQAVQKGVQNGVLIAWMFHELDEAKAAVAARDLDPGDGAPHKVDEAWAFYHGEDPAAAPYATADKRGADFGTGSAVNTAMLAQMTAARRAAAAGDARALKAAVARIEREVLITYIQAALKYAATTDAALAAGDAAEARVEQAEGLAFFRVVAPLVARVDPAAARAVLAEFDLARAPRRGLGDRVATALGRTYRPLGLTRADIGTFSGS